MQVNAGFSGERSRHNLYYSIQAYFANGGGSCFIVPVAGYLSAGKELSARKFIKGIEALDRCDEPTLIVIPEAQNLPDHNRIRKCYDAALAQCARRRDRFAIMDVGRHGQGDDILAVVKQFRQEAIGGANLSFGAAYAPNLLTSIQIYWDRRTSVFWQSASGNRKSNVGVLERKDKKLYGQVMGALEQVFVVLPPSPFVAGVYAQTDESRGVWKAPANISLNGVARPALPVTDIEQEQITTDPGTGKSVNAIRTFPGKGTLVWGARTLAGNDNEWRYVPVRRFALMLEESISKGTQWAVFEPNDEPLWTQLRASVENYLMVQWRHGALAGAKPEQAFFVRTGLGYTMTAQDILDGILIIEVGFAPLKPAEFIILRIVHKK